MSNRLYRNNAVNTAFGEVYAYDGLNQLTSFQRGTLNGSNNGISGAVVRGQSWVYDAAGNTAQLVSDGVPQARAHNYQNEVTALMTGLPLSPPTPVGGNATLSTPAYDSAGNMTDDEAGRSFTFDGWNRLVSAQNQTGVQKSYSYDGLNRRVTETTSDTTTDLYYSAWWQVLEEQVGSDTTRRYVWSPVYVDAMVLRDRDTTGDGTLDERLWVQHLRQPG